MYFIQQLGVIGKKWLLYKIGSFLNLFPNKYKIYKINKQ